MSNYKNIKKLRDLAIRDHYYCEDWFYSCALAENYFGEFKGDKCTCGADEHNAKVTELYKEIIGDM